MAENFFCYVHKPGVIAPELRVIQCRSENEVAEAVAAEMEVWGDFEMIDVYDAHDEPVCRCTPGRWYFEHRGARHLRIH